MMLELAVSWALEAAGPCHSAVPSAQLHRKHLGVLASPHDFPRTPHAD